MPRSFLINDKPKTERGRIEEEEASTMETSHPILPHPTHVSVDSLPYSIAKLTGNCDTKLPENSNGHKSSHVPDTLTSIREHQITSSQDHLHGHGSMRTPVRLPLSHVSGSMLHPIVHHTTSHNSSAVHPAFVNPLVYSSHLTSSNSKSMSNMDFNIPRGQVGKSGINGKVTPDLPMPNRVLDTREHRQIEGDMKATPGPQTTCHIDKAAPMTYVPNFLQGSPANLPSNMFYHDHRAGDRDSRLSSELPPLFKGAKPGSGLPVNPLFSSQPGHMAMFSPYINTSRAGHIPGLPSVFHPTPPRDRTPSSTPTPPLISRPAPTPCHEEARTPSPVEAPRSSTPGDGASRVAGDLSVSVVSTDMDRSSDSGLDSGHQSSDFDGDVDGDEEQIDVVGDDCQEDEPHHEDLKDLEAREQVVDKRSSPPTPIVRPQPKRSTDICLEPISPVSTTSSTSPGSSGIYGSELPKFHDPRFWPTPLHPLSPQYMTGFSSMSHGLSLQRPEGFSLPMLASKESHPQKERNLLPPLNSAMKSSIGFGKHPFIHLQSAIFSGLINDQEAMKHQCNELPLPLSGPPSHPDFPKAPAPSMTMSPPVGSAPLPPSAHPGVQKLPPRPQAPTLPWLLDLPGFGLDKDCNDGRPPVRKASEPPRYQCDACKKSYATFSGLSKHKQFHCESHIKKEFSCKYCDKRYTSLGALKMHIRTHTLPCKCQICGKAFSRPWLLQGHIRTHTGEKPFSCQHCNRAFADRSNLRAHLQTHSDIKKYSCKSCTKTFSRMSLLLKHEENSCPGARGSLMAV